jgi:hypothetical protein
MKVSGEHFEVSRNWREKLYDAGDNLVGGAMVTGGAATVLGTGLTMVTDVMYHAQVSMAMLNPAVVLPGAAALCLAAGGYEVVRRMMVHTEKKQRAIIEEAARRDPALLEKPIGLAFATSQDMVSKDIILEMGVPGEKYHEKASGCTVRKYLEKTENQETFSSSAARAVLKGFVNQLTNEPAKPNPSVVAKIESFIGRTLKGEPDGAQAKAAKSSTPSL